MKFLIQKSYMGLARGSEFHSESHLLDSLRVLDGFLRQDVNKEFQRVNSHCSRQIIKFSMDLSGHVHVHVADPSLIWNTEWDIE